VDVKDSQTTNSCCFTSRWPHGDSFKKSFGSDDLSWLGVSQLPFIRAYHAGRATVWVFSVPSGYVLKPAHKSVVGSLAAYHQLIPLLAAVPAVVVGGG
jgi:hypothetical protein